MLRNILFHSRLRRAYGGAGRGAIKMNSNFLVQLFSRNCRRDAIELLVARLTIDLDLCKTSLLT